MTIHTFDYLPSEITATIRVLFNETLKPGDELLLRFPHRDLIHEFRDDLIQSPFNVLPDRFELPQTFSAKWIIQDALNAICPEVDKYYEEIDFDKSGKLDISQGFYKFMSLTIEEGYIHAVIKKI